MKELAALMKYTTLYPTEVEKSYLLGSGIIKSDTQLLPHSPYGVAVLILCDSSQNTLAYAFSRVSPDTKDPRETTFKQEMENATKKFRSY